MNNEDNFANDPVAANEKPGVGESWSDSAKAAADKVTESAKGAAGAVSESAKAAAGKVSEGAKAVGEAVKAHPYATAAAVGGVAAAAAGAVAGKMYYDKQKQAKGAADEIGAPEMRAGEPEVSPESN